MSAETIGPFSGRWRSLSNYSRDPADYDGVTYPTAEHPFAAAKTLDHLARGRILIAATPAKAKQLGRSATLRNGWDDGVRVVSMLTILRSKFGGHRLRGSGLDPRAVLLDTGSAVLIEHNTWHDNTWGNCTCGRSACAAPGQNLLGGLLMVVRGEIGAAA